MVKKLKYKDIESPRVGYFTDFLTSFDSTWAAWGTALLIWHQCGCVQAGQ